MSDVLSLIRLLLSLFVTLTQHCSLSPCFSVKEKDSVSETEASAPVASPTKSKAKEHKKHKAKSSPAKSSPAKSSHAKRSPARSGHAKLGAAKSNPERKSPSPKAVSAPKWERKLKEARERLDKWLSEHPDA